MVLTNKYYTRLPSGVEFVRAFEEFCDQQGIKPEEIQMFLGGVYDIDSKVEWRRFSWGEGLKELIERGYLELHEGSKIIPEPIMKLDPG